MSLIDEKFNTLPSWLRFLLSISVVIAAMILFLWFNDNFLHLPIGEGNTECSGVYEYNCGDTDDARMNNAENFEPTSE